MHRLFRYACIKFSLNFAQTRIYAGRTFFQTHCLSMLVAQFVLHSKDNQMLPGSITACQFLPVDEDGIIKNASQFHHRVHRFHFHGKIELRNLDHPFHSGAPCTHVPLWMIKIARSRIIAPFVRLVCREGGR